MATGLGGWTDDQIKNAFLNGVDNQNQALFPIMPYFVFHNMSEADADAIVAYLRSIPPVANTIPERDFMFPMAAMPVPATSVPDPTLPPTDPDYASAMRGKYLAGLAGACIECHTTHVQGPVPLDVTKLFAGGDQFPAAELGLPPTFPAIIYSENITSDTTGIAGWAASNVATVIKQGVDKNGIPLCPPMPVGPNGAFGGMTDSDALDIGNYIVHLPPIANTISPICHEVLASQADGGSDAGGDAGAADGAASDGSADAGDQ
jgi:hypothetical protein